MRQLSAILGMALVVAGCAAERPARMGRGEQAGDPLDAGVLVAWNELVLATAEAEDGFLTLKGLRAATMMHLAVHDALNAIDPRYGTYLPVEAASGADPLAAVVGAASEVALHEYPDQRERFGVEARRWLEGVEEGRARARGIELGRAVAARILDDRQSDGWSSEAEYQWHPMGPGVYAEFAEHSGTPQGFVFGSGWAVARPFMQRREASCVSDG